MYVIPECAVVPPHCGHQHSLVSHVEALHQAAVQSNAHCTLLNHAHQHGRTISSSSVFVALWRLEPFELFIAYHWLRSINLLPVFLNSRWSVQEVASVLSSTVPCTALILPSTSVNYNSNSKYQVTNDDIHIIETAIKTKSKTSLIFFRLFFDTTPVYRHTPSYNLSSVSKENHQIGKKPPTENNLLLNPSVSKNNKHSIAAIFFTSGSTSLPKAVPLTDANIHIQSLTKHEILNLSSSSRYLHLSPLFHLGGFSSAHAISLINGTHLFSCHPKSISSSKVNVIVGVPSSLISLAKLKDSYSPHVKTVLYGGSGGMTQHIRDEIIMKAWPNAIIIGAYGMTETASSMTFLNHSTLNHNDHLQQSVGFPPVHVRLKVRKLYTDANNNEVGEILTKGPHVFHGYFNDNNSNSTRNNWFSTGDIGYIDTQSGALFVHGRKYDVIKSGGENVFAPEVEAHLLQDPYILDAAVVGLPHSKFGTVVAAAVQLKYDAITGYDDDDDDDQLQQLQSNVYSKRKLIEDVHRRCEVLAEFKRPWWIVALTKQLPRTVTGKIMKEKVNSMLKNLIIENVAIQQQQRNSGLSTPAPTEFTKPSGIVTVVPRPRPKHSKL